MPTGSRRHVLYQALMLRSPDLPALQTAISRKRKNVRAHFHPAGQRPYALSLHAKRQSVQTNTPTVLALINAYQARTGHTDYRLAKIAGISPSVISRLRAGGRPGWEVCYALAGAMGLPPEQLFRAAGLLPSRPEIPAAELDQLNRLYSKLSPWQKRLVLKLVSALLDDQDQPAHYQ